MSSIILVRSLSDSIIQSLLFLALFLSLCQYLSSSMASKVYATPPMMANPIRPYTPRYANETSRQKLGNNAAEVCRRALQLSPEPKERSGFLSAGQDRDVQYMTIHQRTCSQPHIRRSAHSSRTTTITTTKPEKQVRTGMGLREQEQHLVKMGRENWALKLDITLMKQKRDELSRKNEGLVNRVESLTKQTSQLKEDLAKTRADLKNREAELDEAYKMIEKLGQTMIILRNRLKGLVQPSGEAKETSVEKAPDESIKATPMKAAQISNPTADRRPVTPIANPYRMASPTMSGSIDSGVWKRQETVIPSYLPACKSPSISRVSSICSLPSYARSEYGENGRYDTEAGGDEVVDERSGKEFQMVHDEEAFIQKKPVNEPDSPESMKKKNSYRRRVLKFNRCHEADSSEYSSGEDDIFNSDFEDDRGSVPHTPMTQSPEPSHEYKTHHSPTRGDYSRIPYIRPPSRLGYASPFDTRSIDQRSINSAKAASLYCFPIMENVAVKTGASEMEKQLGDPKWSRIPTPSVVGAAARKRRHLDTMTRLSIQREVLTRRLQGIF